MAASRMLSSAMLRRVLQAQPPRHMATAAAAAAVMPASSFGPQATNQQTHAAGAGGAAAAVFPQQRHSSAAQHDAGVDYIVTAPHMRVTKNLGDDYTLSHAVYTKEEVDGVRVTHYDPKTWSDTVALQSLLLVRRTFDMATGYGHNMTAAKYMTRIIFLESVAGVPGMVAAMARHFRSLRSMSRDMGWIHTLLEEAENERMHLLTFLELNPKAGPAMRAMVLLAQGVFFNSFFIAYMIAPRTCHRWVGFLEEEAVKTYTKAIEDYDAGKLPEWQGRAAPDIAKKYWRLSSDATMRDLLLAVRADEAIHRDVNHVFSTLPANKPNPFK